MISFSSVVKHKDLDFVYIIVLVAVVVPVLVAISGKRAVDMTVRLLKK